MACDTLLRRRVGLEVMFAAKELRKPFAPAALLAVINECVAGTRLNAPGVAQMKR